MNMIEQVQAIREAMDYAGATLTEEMALICVHIYRPWAVNTAYKVDEYLTYGVNSVGDPQLYKVVQAHMTHTTKGTLWITTALCMSP